MVENKPEYSNISSHYDEMYFEWQNKIGAIGGKLNAGLFTPYMKSSDRVLEFGCGGGWLLAELNCKDKIGLEITPSAADFAANYNKLTVYRDISEIPDNWADVIISNHALEHSRNPFFEISSLHAKLKPGGKLVFVVPHETIHRKYLGESDINNHLYTWSPLNLANLFIEAGYTVTESKALYHKFPPFYNHIIKLGTSITVAACRMWGFVSRRTIVSVRIICEKTRLEYITSNTVKER